MDNELTKYVEDFYKNIEKKITLGKDVELNYYKSLRGYFKHSIILTDIKEKEFRYMDYRIWDRMLTLVKSSHEPTISGGLFFKYDDYEDFCSIRAFYKTKKKLLNLKLLLPTPFKHYYLLNPLYVIKLYNPK